MIPAPVPGTSRSSTEDKGVIYQPITDTANDRFDALQIRKKKGESSWMELPIP
jgi:hypothetical protein